MSRQDDVADRALELLRSEQWAADPLNDELEKRLMQEFNTRQSNRKSGRSRMIAAALGLVVIGGATFASGGINTLKSWLMTISVNGETTEILLDENGENTFTIDTEDGGTATVHVERSVTPEDGEMTQIEVHATSDDLATEEKVKIIRKSMADLAESEFTLADLGDAEPVKEWTDASGAANSLYILPGENDSGSRLFFVTPGEDGEPTVTQIAATPFSLLDGENEPTIEVGDDGMVTLGLDNGEGKVMEMKFMCKRQSEGDPTEPVHVEMPERQITISLEAVEAD